MVEITPGNDRADRNAAWQRRNRASLIASRTPSRTAPGFCGCPAVPAPSAVADAAAPSAGNQMCSGDRIALRTTLRDNRKSRAIALIGLPLACSRLIRRTVSKTNILISPPETQGLPKPSK
jgi:hypothetical protein